MPAILMETVLIVIIFFYFKFLYRPNYIDSLSLSSNYFINTKMLINPKLFKLFAFLNVIGVVN